MHTRPATRVLVPRDQPGIARGVRKAVTLDLLRDLGAIPPP